jgi:hypothetical protein
LWSDRALQAGQPTRASRTLGADRACLAGIAHWAGCAGLTVRAALTLWATRADEPLRTARADGAGGSGYALSPRQAGRAGRAALAVLAGQTALAGRIVLGTRARRVLVSFDEGDTPRSTVRIRAGRTGKGDATDRENGPREENCAHRARAIDVRKCH